MSTPNPFQIPRKKKAMLKKYNWYRLCENFFSHPDGKEIISLSDISTIPLDQLEIKLQNLR